MKPYERIFGSGPSGALISILLLLITYFLQDYFGLNQIFTNNVIRYSVFIVFSIFGVALVVWSVLSLPVKERGRTLVVTGAFKFFRHPLYAAFLILLNFGFAFLLNNWIYICWAVLMFPIWALNIRSEEKLMEDAFGDEYKAYCDKTWRFFPRL